MSQKRFLVPTLLAAGFGATHEAQATFTKATLLPENPDNTALITSFRFGHMVSLAQHRSHSSHSSHSSHRSSSGGGHYSHTSHRSSTGGYGGGYGSSIFTTPAPSPAPTPSPSPRKPQSFYTAPSTTVRASPPGESAPTALSGRSDKFKSIVRRVQIALMARGLYQGEIDGTVGPALRAALRKFQTAQSLSVTGTITPETLDALRIASD